MRRYVICGSRSCHSQSGRFLDRVMAASGVSQSYEKGGDDSTHAVSAFFTLARLYTLTAGRPTLEFSAFERDGVRRL